MMAKWKLIFSCRDNWGDGYCDLNHNNAENFFDVGDCCLEDLQCRLKFFNFTNFIPRFCPENTCIKSNLFCIPEELGDGICQDHNNGPFFDFDLGDCCLHLSLGNPKNEQEQPDCCTCSCRIPFESIVHHFFWICLEMRKNKSLTESEGRLASIHFARCSQVKEHHYTILGSTY